MRIDLSGQVRIEDGGRVLDESQLPGRQGRVVLTRLALASDPVHRDVLADVLWPDGPPATWERTLSGVVSRLRSAFTSAGFDGLTIANAFGCYELQRPGDAVIDVHLASDEAAAAERALAVGDLTSAVTAASSAAGIARRPLLAGEDGDWLDAPRSDLRSVLVRALDVQAAATLGTSDALAAATEAIELEPFRETSHVLLMRAHAALGNTADALLSYERCRAMLAEELGIDPSPETQALHLALLQADEDALIDTLQAQGLVRLPATVTSFVGRTSDLDGLLDLISRERLVTLTGPGGVGKTRLAIEAARSTVASFQDGVRFVDLTTLSAPGRIADHVAVALGLGPFERADVEAIAAVLGARRVLVLMDNCDHLLEACAPFLAALVAATDAVNVLATSRLPLAVDRERVFEVSPMALPDVDDEFDRIAAADAVVLFGERAAAARPGFAVTSANASAIASICRRLDGVPLAIELVAARVGAMSIVELGEYLSDLFEFAGDGSHIARHRTLRTVIDFSYDLLARREAETFRSLSVFEGTFSVDDASAVCGEDVAAVVESLALHSLVARTTASDENRYRMLETIKEYARERISTTPAWDVTIDRHIARYGVLLPELDVGDRAVAEARQSVVAADATMALERALERGRTADAVAIGASLWGLWLSRGPLAEGRSFLERVLAAALEAGHEKELDWIYDGLGTIAQNQGDLAGAERFYRDGLEFVTRVGDDKQRAVFLINLAATVGSAGRHDEEAELTQRAVEVAEASGSDFAAARAHMVLGYNALARGDVEGGRRSYSRALELFSGLGHTTGIIRAESGLATIGWPDGAAPDWRERLERVIAIAQENNDVSTEAMIVLQLGYSLVEIGEWQDGLARIKEALTTAAVHGSRRTALSAIEQVACTAAEYGDPVEALVLFAAVEALRSSASIVSSYQNVDRLESLRTRAMSRAGIPADQALTDGSQLSFEEACDRAMGAAFDVNVIARHR